MLGRLVEAVECARSKAMARKDKAAAKASGFKSSVLQNATDWKISADLPNMRIYPDVIKKSNVRPDMVLVSEKSKTVVVIELTVPFESNMGESHEFKLAKYEELMADLHKSGYKSQIFAIEVEARGLVGATAYILLKRLGHASKERKKYLKQVGEAAEKASHWIWLKRNEKTWTNQ